MTTLNSTTQTATEIDYRDPVARLERLFDANSMQLLNTVDRSGVVTASGLVEGVHTIAFCTDATIMGGAMGIDGCAHIVNAYDRAIDAEAPCIGVWHSGGARLAEGVEALHGVGGVFEAMVRASGKIPQISVVLGPAAGGAAYGPALTDIVIMAPDGKVFVTGPDVVRSVTGEQVDMDGLGGTDVHHRKSGVCHIAANDEQDALNRARSLVDYLENQGGFASADAPEVGSDLSQFLPQSPKRAYDVHPLIHNLLDSKGENISNFEELQSKWAPNIVVGFGRLTGRTVGVIANNPLRLGGCLNSESAEKASRFVRLCNAFGVPLVVIVDVPGYLPGVTQEWDGVVRRGAKLLHAFAEASVARVTLVTRKIYGGAYIAMNSRALGATAVYAWPDAEVAVMGAKAAVGILHKRALAAAADDEREALHDRLAEEHEKIAGGVGRAMSIGVVDEVIEPSETRMRIANALANGNHARGDHKNIPL